MVLRNIWAGYWLGIGIALGIITVILLRDGILEINWAVIGEWLNSLKPR